MNTYKVTFYEENLEVASIVTFHNIGNQAQLLYLIASNIHVREYLPMVRCFRGEEELTVEVNHFLKGYLRDLKKTDISKLKPSYKPSYKPFRLIQ